MEGSTAKKSTSLETLVIQNICNVNELKSKLNDIIKTGKDYEYDVSSCIKSLITNSDQEIVLLSVQAISELVKCEEKRQTYAEKDVILPILNILQKEITTDRTELVKQSCRALGNLCCDCDASRKLILENNGVKILKNVLEKCSELSLTEIKVLVCKTYLNFGIGGQEYCETVIQEGVVDLLDKMLKLELASEDMNDDVVSTVLVLLSVINENVPEVLHEGDININVLKVLKETTNIEISELCLDHLHSQAEHDSVKTLLALEGGIHLVCSRLEHLISRHEEGEMMADDAEVEAVIKQACDLTVIVLTGDEAMQILYNNGTGEVYSKMVTWLESSNYHLLTTAILGIGNFARQDDYCTQMMENKIYDKILDIFEAYASLPPVAASTAMSRSCAIQSAALSALRNLVVCDRNKRSAPHTASQRLLHALERDNEHQVACKLLAALRMLMHGQESVARALVLSPSALRNVCACGGGGGAGAGEAPRLLAWAVRELRHDTAHTHMVQVEGCITCIANMLLTSHSIMQNEAILALTLLSMECLKKHSPDSTPEYDYGTNFTSQLIKSEIGKHIAVLVDTNCAKMPVEVAENLLAFLDITTKKNEICSDYRESKVHESLQKFKVARSDLSDDLKLCISAIIKVISGDD